MYRSKRRLIWQVPPAKACNATPNHYKRALTRARSSAGEHLVDIEGVTGSIPVVPTMITPWETGGFFFVVVTETWPIRQNSSTNRTIF